MIAIIDYDIGNIAAVANMISRIGSPCTITSLPEEVERAERIILPGNGSFDSCMKSLRATGLIPVIEDRVLGQGVPLLGICVGAQILGVGSEEGEEPGLGWFDMQVRRFPDTQGLPVPHMGWNQVYRDTDNDLARDMEPDARFYFVHSYYMDPANKEEIFLYSKYGIDFAAGVSRKNIAGVQFHPEKSHRFGRQLLAAFVSGEK